VKTCELKSFQTMRSRYSRPWSQNIATYTTWGHATADNVNAVRFMRCMKQE